MYRLAKNQAKYCAKKGRLVHSTRPALYGGENLFFIASRIINPRIVVNTWMLSFGDQGNPGHRDWLLDHRVKFAAVGIHRSKKGTYVAWSFSSDHKLEKPKALIWTILSPIMG
jgi:hypothetical protein